jgi:hypothetical protein
LGNFFIEHTKLTIVSASRPPAEATEALNRVCFCLLVAAGCCWLLLLLLSRFAGSPASAAEAAGTAAIYSRGFLGLLGAPLVHVWANLDLFLSKNGSILGCLKLSWGILGASWAYFGPPWGYLGLFEAVLSHFGVILGPFLDQLGAILGYLRPS